MKNRLFIVFICLLVLSVIVFGCGKVIEEIVEDVIDDVIDDKPKEAKGELDTSFTDGTNLGWVVYNHSGGGKSLANAITIDASGNILVCGYIVNASGNEDMAIWRFKPNGSLDTTFGGKGYVVDHNAAGGNDDDRGYDIAVDSSGKILVCGYSKYTPDYDDKRMVIWRYTQDGILDSAFDDDGIVVFDQGQISHRVKMGIDDTSGKITLCGGIKLGSDNFDMIIWRYKPDGSLDTSFGTLGYVTHDEVTGGGDWDFGRGIILDSNKILVCGSSGNKGEPNQMVIWRYGSTGELDTTFGTEGYVVAGGVLSDAGYDISVNSGGKIIVAGYIGDDMAVWRYNSNGTPDNTFTDGSNNGCGIYPASASEDDWANSMTLDLNEKILVCGELYLDSGIDQMVVWRVKKEGSLDQAFTDGTTSGYITHNDAANGKSAYGNDIIVDSSGKILVAGYNYKSGDQDMVIWRFK